MRKVPAPTDGTPTRRLVGRMAAALYIACGLVTIAGLALPTPQGINQAAVTVVGLIATAIGILYWFLPWQAWPRAATLWLTPIAFVLIAVYNHFSAADPYHFSLYYVVIFAWMGITHPRYTSFYFLPVLLPAYLVPLITSGNANPVTLSSVVYCAPVCILISEMLAWMSDRLSRLQQDLAIRQSEERFLTLIQNSSDLITIVDADTTIHYQTPAVERLLGYRPGELLGTRLVDLLHPDDLAQAQDYYATWLNHPGITAPVEWRMRSAGGSWLPVETIGNNLLHDPNVLGVVLNIRDIGERKRLEERLTHQAFHDPLTNLANRALFRRRVAQGLEHARQHQTLLAIMFLDLDNFKTVNDTLGHLAGDQLLIAVAARLQQSVRTGDTVARHGGDEFAILLEDLSHEHDLQLVAERIVEQLNQPFILAERACRVTASVGIALYHNTEQLDELLRQADVAMYQTKAAGKSHYTFYNPNLDHFLPASGASEPQSLDRRPAPGSPTRPLPPISGAFGSI